MRCLNCPRCSLEGEDVDVKELGVTGEQLRCADVGTSPLLQAIIQQQLSPVGEALAGFYFPDI